MPDHSFWAVRETRRGDTQRPHNLGFLVQGLGHHLKTALWEMRSESDSAVHGRLRFGLNLCLYIHAERNVSCLN